LPQVGYCFFAFFRSFLDCFSEISGFSIEIHIRIPFLFPSFSECWQVGPLRWPVVLLQVRFPPWLKPLVTAPAHNSNFLNSFLLDYTKNAYNQRAFSNVTYTNASLPSQMLTTKLPTMHFTMVVLDNRNLWVVGRSITLTY